MSHENRRIIAISGKMRAGKDTFAEVFTSIIPTFNRVGFADELKREFAALHYITVDDINTYKDIYRERLINYGAMKRAESPLYWVSRALIHPNDIIITDLRFRNEYDHLTMLGKTTFIRIESSTEERSKRGKVIDNDPSETELDKGIAWDFVLENNGTLEEFKENVALVTNDVSWKSMYSLY